MMSKSDLNDRLDETIEEIDLDEVNRVEEAEFVELPDDELIKLKTAIQKEIKD